MSQFTDWEKDGAKIYVNFSDASKEDNGGNDIALSSADKDKYNPKEVNLDLNLNQNNHVYGFIVSNADAGKSVLRFWRGNENTLWNCSTTLTYNDYLNGINTVKILEWNNDGGKVVYDETSETTESGIVIGTTEEDTDRRLSVDYELDLNIDSDGDELPDFNEIIIGTDKNNPDTDGDGLKDSDEVRYGYDPLVIDTDDNGITDGDEDFDGDGLSNSEENYYGTSIVLQDTDEDGLSDYDEIFKYHTDPLNPDTDGDGILDGDEIYLGTDSLKADSDDNGITDNEEVFKMGFKAEDFITYYDEDVYPELEVKGNAEVLCSLDIDTRDWDHYINCNIPGYIATAYDFTCDGEFESAKVTFNISDEYMEYLSEEDFEPAIYYFNEETKFLEKLENQVIDGNKVIAELEHFSTYILLNSKEFDAVWENEIKYYDDEELNKPFRIGFILDCSHTMSVNDPYYIRNKVSNNIIEKMDEDEEGFVIFSMVA